MEVLVVNHFFQNRLYIGAGDANLNKSVFQSDNNKGPQIEQYGAGIRCYGHFIGVFLNALGYATPLLIDQKIYYVNKNSFAEFIIRSTEIKNPTSANDAAKKLTELYVQHKKNGYNSEKVRSIAKEASRKLNYMLHVANEMEQKNNLPGREGFLKMAFPNIISDLQDLARAK